MIKRKNKAILCAIASIAMANSGAALPVSVMAAEKVVDSRATTTKMEVYNTSSLNVRKGPSTKYAKIGTVSKGQVLEVVSISNGWAKINFNGGTGYCSTSYLKKVVTTVKKNMTVKVDDLSVRTGTSTKNTLLGKLKKGTVVTVVEEFSNGWVKIEYNKGYGYVSNVKGAYLSEVVSAPEQPNTPPVPDVQKKEMVVKVDDLNVRTGTSTKNASLGKLKKGTTVTVVQTYSNGWVKIEFNKGYGYVSNVKGAYLGEIISTPEQPESQPTPETPESTPIKKKEMVAKVNDLNVRAGASIKDKSLGKLNKGDVVIALEVLSNSWVKIEYKGQTGYVSNVKGAYLEEGPYVEDRESANKVIELIKTLDKEISLTDKDSVVSVREAYNKLNADAKKLVSNLSTLTNAESKIKELESAQKEAEAVIALIDALDSTIELDDKEQVLAAKKAFDALSSTAQALVTNVDKLTNAVAEIEKLEKEKVDIETSNEVIAAIDEIKGLAKVELINKELIAKARMAYDSLSPEAKALVSVETLKVLEDAEAELIKLEKEENDKKSAELVQSKIESLNKDIVISDEKTVEDIRSEFNKLSPEAKLLVSNISILEAAEEKITEKKSQYENVMNLIGHLPNNITLQDEAQVKAAREAFDKLEQDIKDAITTGAKEHYQILTSAEEKIQRLKEESQTEEPEVDPVQSIQDKMASLTGKELTLDDKDTVVQIRKEYDALPNELKPQILVSLIEEFEMQIGWLEKVKSIQDRIDVLSKRELELADKDAVVQIRNDYNALPHEFKAKISEDSIEALELEIEGLEYIHGRLDEGRKKEYEQKTANAVIAKINLLQKDILLTDYTSILTARSEYNKLVPEAKLLVYNLDILESAEATIEAKKNRYDRAMNLIGALPDDITLEHEAQIIEAREAFNALTDDEEAHLLQFKEHYQLLTRAEEALARLKAEI